MLAQESCAKAGLQNYMYLIGLHLAHDKDVVVTHMTQDTPKRRLENLNTVVPVAETPEPFNKRKRLTHASASESSE